MAFVWRRRNVISYWSMNHDASHNFSLLRSSRPDFGFVLGPRTDPRYFSTVRRVWSNIISVGPTLKVAGLMIRNVWDIELRGMKNAYYATQTRYKLGLHLLRADLRISVRLMIKVSRGMTLSRRERQLLTRTTADIFTCVPGSIYVVVPPIEVLLPVILRLYPKILPLTFKDKMEEQGLAIRKIKARREFAKFLNDTASEIVKRVQNSFSGDIKLTAEEYIEFSAKILGGAPVSSEDILGFGKLFSDELTVFNIGRPMLVMMCKCMGITPLGTDEYLRFILQERLKFIKEDDQIIQAKGMESLSEAELRKACGQRGIHAAKEMHQQLHDWLDISLNHSIPSSILILSRICNVTGTFKPVEAVLHAISILPHELQLLVVASLPCKSPINDKCIKLESLDMLEKLIKEEEKELSAIRDDVSLKKMTVSMHKQDRARVVDKYEQHLELINDNVCMECEKISRLVNTEADFMLQNSVNVIDDMDSEIDGYWQVLDRKVTPDFVGAATFLKNTLDKGGIEDLLSTLSKYKGLLKSIFLDVKKKFEIAIRVLREEKITIDPEDTAVVAQNAKVMQTVREKIPEHKIWESESAIFRSRAPPLGPSIPVMEFGLDYQHWLVQVKLPDCEMSRDEIIHFYINLLAEAVGSEENARMKIYSVSTKHYFAFGALVDEEVASKLRDSPKVLAVDPDCYLDAENKNYGGEPFINGESVPYEQKYHDSYWKMQEALYRPSPPHTDRMD